MFASWLRHRTRKPAVVSVRPRLEALEDRCTPATLLNLGGVDAINSYAGVGFRLNPVANFNGFVNGQQDFNAGDFSAQINWGDGTGWTTGVIAPNGDGSSVAFTIKGSHVYNVVGDFKVEVMASGPGGTSQTSNTTEVIVSNMPSSFPGTPPPAVAPVIAPTTVAFNLGGVDPINSYAGVGFQENQIAPLNGYVNGQTDLTATDFHAFVNWGDSSQWYEADVVANHSGSSVAFLIEAGHVYAQVGQYNVVVYAVGPDGTSTANATTSVIVSNMPSGIPGVPPPPTTSVSPPTNVAFNLGGVDPINAVAGVPFQANSVATLNGYVNGQTDPYVTDFQAWINWGDSASWTPATIVKNNGGSSVSFYIEAGHTYAQAGDYPVVVYAVGPGGTSTTGATAQVIVSAASGGGGVTGGGSGDVVFLQKTDDSLWQHSATAGWQMLSPTGTVLSISAVTDAAGNADVFVIAADRTLWEHTPSGWAMLSAGSFQQINAATKAAGVAVVFAVPTDRSLWEYSSLFTGGWSMLSPGGTVLSVSAVTDAAGHDDVYAITADSHLWEHTPSAWTFLSAGSFEQVSAGLNTAGQSEVFGVLTDNSLWENNPALPGGWQELSGAGTVLSVSAGAPDAVFAITSDGHLWEHTATAGWSFLSGGSFASLSGTANSSGRSEVFATLADTSFWEYNPALTGGWADLLSSGAAAESAPRQP